MFFFYYTNHVQRVVFFDTRTLARRDRVEKSLLHTLYVNLLTDTKHNHNQEKQKQESQLSLTDQTSAAAAGLQVF